MIDIVIRKPNDFIKGEFSVFGANNRKVVGNVGDVTRKKGSIRDPNGGTYETKDVNSYWPRNLYSTNFYD
jgi:hypothetical protein